MNKTNLSNLGLSLLRDNQKLEFDILCPSYCEGRVENEYLEPRDVEGLGVKASTLGHAPLIFKPKISENWAEYGDRVFALNDEEWSFIFFDHNWRGIDETRKGAGQRILWMVENGCPHDWQLADWLCFKKPLPWKN